MMPGPCTILILQLRQLRLDLVDSGGTKSTGGVSGGAHVRGASGQRRIGGLDQRAQELAVRDVLPRIRARLPPLRRAENARSVRDALSGDVFEALNGAYLTLSRGLTTAASPGASMHRVLERLMVVNGAVEWTMSRDEGHYFLTLGRSLERIDMTARLLDVRHDLVWPDTGAVAVLRSAAALSPFLRTGEAPSGQQVREFLVLDPDFPRSMLHRARAAEDAVRGLQRLGGVDDGDLLREVGLMRSRLEFAGGSTDPDVVDDLVTDTQMSAVASAAATADAYFRQAGTVVWSQ